MTGTAFTGYQAWPSGFTKGSSAFSGGVYNGNNIWLIPQNANSLVKVDAATAVMTEFNNWASGFATSTNMFLGGVYDGNSVWMIPFGANRLMRFGLSPDLNGLTLSAGVLSPAFDLTINNYTTTVGNEVTSINVTPTPADSSATVTVNGSPVTSGQSQAPALNVGATG